MCQVFCPKIKDLKKKVITLTNVQNQHFRLKDIMISKIITFNRVHYTYFCPKVKVQTQMGATVMVLHRAIFCLGAPLSEVFLERRCPVCSVLKPALNADEIKLLNLFFYYIFIFTTMFKHIRLLLLFNISPRFSEYSKIIFFFKKYQGLHLDI